MTKRDRLTLIVLAVVVVIGGFWMLALKPLRAELEAVDGQVAAEQDRLLAVQRQAADARDARERYVQDYAVIARLGKAVPADDDLPSLMVQLQSAAEGAAIDFTSVKLAGGGLPTPAAAPPAAQVAAVGAAEKGNAPPPAGGAAPAAPAAATQAASAGLPPGATVGPAGLATMPFTFTFEGSFLRMQRFLARVQRFIAAGDEGLRVRGRLLTIDGIGLTPGAEGFPTVKATLTATAYVLPEDEGLTAGATPQAPAPGAPAPSLSAAPAAPPAPGTATASASPTTVAAATP